MRALAEMQVLAAAGAMERVAAVEQRGDDPLVSGRPVVLVEFGLVPMQGVCPQAGEYPSGCALLFARRVQILDAQKPGTAMRAGIEEARKRSTQGSEVERAGG